MDAITLLKDDHKTVEELFKRFEKAGDRAFTEKRDLVDRIIEELSKHAAVEEQLFYPVTRETVPEVDDLVLEGLEEHHIVEWVLSELQAMDTRDERFDAKVTVLIENVRHHVEEEEGDFFPKVRAELGRKALNELGDAMEAVKQVAPTHPHPRSPSSPPANFVVGTAAGVVDRIGDTVSGLAQGSVSAVQDVIDRVRGEQSRRPSPTGTTTARRTARTVRSGTNDALDRAIDAVREARDTGAEVADRAETAGRQTAETARNGVKRTAGTARQSAKATAHTAKAKAGARRTARGATKPNARRPAKKS